MLSWEKKPKLYIYSIYIHIFIYLFLSLPSVYSYSHVGSHKCNRPTTAKGGKRQKFKKKKKKNHHTSCSLDGENHSLCVYIVKVTGFIAMVMNMKTLTGCICV